MYSIHLTKLSKIIVRNILKTNISLKSKNLYIRSLKVSDISACYIKGLNNYNLVKYTEARHKKWNYNNVKNNIVESKKNKLPFLGIFNLKNKHSGSIRLPGYDKYNNMILLGIMIFSPDYSNRGYGSEALKAITEYLLNEGNCNKIVADYCIKNKPSAKLFKNCNYKIECRLKKNVYVDNKYEDSIIVSITK